MQYGVGYADRSDPDALKQISRYEKDAHDAQFCGNFGYVTSADVLLEGRFEKNPRYHVEFDRGDETLAAWEYAYRYAFVVTRIVSFGHTRTRNTSRGT